MMQKKKSLLGLIMALVMVMTLLPGVSLTARAAESVAINSANFPDANFRAIVNGFDSNHDGALSEAECAAVTSISCPNENIASLQGVAYFPNLETLNCSHNQLTALDVSQNAKLKDLDCRFNDITDVDVSGCPVLLTAMTDGTLNNTPETSTYSDGTGRIRFDRSANIIAYHHGIAGHHAIFSEDFETADAATGLPEGWTQEDADGDGNGWISTVVNDQGTIRHHGRGSLYSESYINFFGLLTPNNWLYTPEITLPANCSLTFSYAAQDEDYPDEKLGVYISVDGGSYTQLGGDYTPKANRLWTEGRIDLSAYAGKTVRFAFVHHNVSDQFRLALDCVAVWAPDVVTHTVTFDANGHGTPPIASIAVEHGKTLWSVIDSFSEVAIPDTDGFFFYDYSLDSDNDPAKWFDFDNPIAADVTLYAIWVPTYTITLDAGGGSVTPGTLQTVDEYGAIPAPPTPTRPGFSFGGWYTQAEGGDWVTEGTEFAADTTLHARWAAHPAPFVKGFYFETAPDVEGWTFMDSDGDGRCWDHPAEGFPLEGEGYLRSLYNASAAADNWAVSPAVDLPAQSACATLWVRGSSSSEEHFAVYAGESADVSQMTRVSGDADLIATAVYQRVLVDLSAFAGKTVYLAVRHLGVVDGYNLRLDQVEFFGTDETATTISHVAMTIDAPAVGAAPDTTLTVTTTPADALTQSEFPVVWYESDTDSWADAVPMTTETFQSGRFYFLSWPTEPYIGDALAEGYSLGEACGASLNGETVDSMADYIAFFPLEVTYTVTFDANGHGTPPIASLEVAYGACIWDYIEDFDEVRIPNTDGYELYDWSLYPDNDPDKVFFFSTPITGDITLYAIWLPASTVSFDATDGTGTMADVKNVAGDFVLPPSGFTAPAGKQFKTWAMGSPDGTQILPGAEANITGDVTFYAVWEDIPADVKTPASLAVTTDPAKTEYTAGETFDPAGMVVTVTYDDSSTAEVTGFVYAPAGPLTTGVTEILVSYTEGGVTVSTTVAVTVTAPTTFTVTFDAAGGTVSPASAVTGTDGKLAALPTPEYTDYAFVGWFTDPVAGEAVTTDTVFTADATIYARWIYFGGGGGGYVTTYTLTFNTNGGSAIDSITRAAGSIIQLADYKPTKANCTFAGWYADAALETAVTQVNLTANTTVYAKWTVINPFTDVSEGDYFYDAVMWAVENGVTVGTTPTTFSPEEGCTRAQMVTFLWRSVGSPAATGTIPFTDVPTDAYYYPAVLWAYNRGIVIGTSATTYSPDMQASRAHVTTLLYRYHNRPAVSGSMPFTDVPAEEYYFNAVLWAVRSRFVQGTTETTFSPDDDCTRAHMAVLLYRTRIL